MSSVVANIYAEMLEDLALTTNRQSGLGRDSVHDTFSVTEEISTRTFLDHLKSLCPSINFIMELGKVGSLPFLDTLLTQVLTLKYTASPLTLINTGSTLLSNFNVWKEVWPNAC